VSQETIRKSVTGKAVPVQGDDIDTDRIIPARFMKGITFEGLEKHVFEDVRVDEHGKSKNHPFDQAPYQGANVLLVNKNFGCGSSREHAPQALQRWGIRAIVGESFAEIFFGNCTTLGIPAVVVGEEVIKKLQASAGENPAQEFTVDVEKGEIRYSGGAVPCAIPAGARKQLVEGSWDGTAILLAAKADIEKTAARIPYVAGF
jgi:3-isopropylmalate/(R)-2-methylmalate dehydratase small subunit